MRTLLLGDLSLAGVAFDVGGGLGVFACLEERQVNGPVLLRLAHVAYVQTYRLLAETLEVGWAFCEVVI